MILSKSDIAILPKRQCSRIHQPENRRVKHTFVGEAGFVAPKQILHFKRKLLSSYCSRDVHPEFV